MRRLAFLVACLPLISCASAMSGRFEDIRVSSSPSQANATLLCANRPSGEGLTPVTFKIRRNAGDCTLTLRKDGYEDHNVVIEQGVNPLYWSNMLFSPVAPVGAVIVMNGKPEDSVLGVGLIGAAAVIFGTDFWTGAVHIHRPAQVDVVLKPK